MSVTIASNLEKINSLENAKRYARGILRTGGKKTCTELGRSLKKSHDAVQRDLNAIARHPEEVRTHFLSEAVKKTKKWRQRLIIIDHTGLHKKHAKAIEGVSRQHLGADGIGNGISLGCTVISDGESVLPLDAIAWKKGDESKVKTTINGAIGFVQKLNADALLADAHFASVESMQKCIETGTNFVFRFHANRTIEVDDFEGKIAVKKHPAFRFKGNQRHIVQEVLWHGLSLRIIKLRVERKFGGWRIIFLVTNASFKKALRYAKMYRIRWKIEVFFRTMKQRFGLTDCRARTLAKQEAHCLSALLSYLESS